MFCIRRFALFVLIGSALAGSLAARDQFIPLTNWAAPLYWQAPAAVQPRGKAMERQPLTAGAITPPLVFVGMTPCRVMDTRAEHGQTGAFGPPTLGVGETRTVPLPTHPTCGVPSTALAYSLNVSVVPSGPLGYITMWPTGTTRPLVATLSAMDGQIHNNAAIVPGGTGGSVDVFVTNVTDVILDINGYYTPQITLLPGSADAPSLSFEGDEGTGIFSSAPGSLNIATAGVNRLTVDDAGRVGIGVASPGQKLHLGDGNILIEGGDETALQMKRDFTTTGVPSGTGPSHNPIFYLGRIQQAGDGDPEFRLLYSDYTSPERSVFEIDRKGIAASVKWDRGSHFEGFLCLTDERPCPKTAEQPVFRLNSYPRMRLEMGDGKDNPVDVAVQREAANTLTILTGGLERLRVDAAGNVAIGTTAARDTLEVNGEIRVADCVKNSSGAQIAGSCPSDARLKTNIQPFSSVLAKLVRLQPVHFDWRAAEYPDYHFGSSRSYGLVAQEVERDFPELVSEDRRGFKAVNYSELPLLLLQAVREMKTENDLLHQQLGAQERQNRQQGGTIQSLETRLAALEASLSGRTPSALAAGH
jgi:hypothetical protein